MGISRAHTVDVVIADEASLSDSQEVGSGEIAGLAVPTIVSAALTFQGSVDGTTFFDLYDNDGTTETAIGASTGGRFFAAPAALSSVPYLKVRSGTSAAAVNQTSGPITITVVFK